MTIILPRLHRSAEYEMKPVYAGTETLQPATGGPRMPVDRPGDHWALEIDTGTLRTSCGQALMADIVRGRAQPVAIQIPEPGIDKGSPGDLKVDGAGQAGEFLNVRGGNPSVIIRKGWFISVYSGGHWYAHMVTQTTANDLAGSNTLSLWPMLRAPHADNDLVEVAKPMIEGLVVEGGDYGVRRPHIVRPGTILIEENQ